MAIVKMLSVLLISILSACTTTADRVLPNHAEHVEHAEVSYDEPPFASSVIDNCSVGCPLGGGAVTLHRQAYSLNNNSSTKFANWVAYRITKASSATGRKRNWLADPDIPVGETLEPADYKGASRALKIDRGHQANLASMAGVADWRALNYLSNITPQKADLNQGPWAHLETLERELSKKEGVDSVYVVTGPLYERFIGTLPGTTKEHVIPSGYWKVIFTGDSPSDGFYASFLMDQNTPRFANFCDFQVTIEQIENRSGLKIWSELNGEVKNTLSVEKGRLAAMIGCS